MNHKTPEVCFGSSEGLVSEVHLCLSRHAKSVIVLHLMCLVCRPATFYMHIGFYCHASDYVIEEESLKMIVCTKKRWLLPVAWSQSETSSSLKETQHWTWACLCWCPLENTSCLALVLLPWLHYFDTLKRVCKSEDPSLLALCSCQSLTQREVRMMSTVATCLSAVESLFIRGLGWLGFPSEYITHQARFLYSYSLACMEGLRVHSHCWRCIFS